jgi:hypothetical protein
VSPSWLSWLFLAVITVINLNLDFTFMLGAAEGRMSAMSDLGIEGQELTDQEVAMLEAEEDKNLSV